MKLITKFLMTCLLATATSCTIDSNSFKYEDPFGTIITNITMSDRATFQYYGHVRWCAPDNFYLFIASESKSVSICDLGKVKSLGHIKKIPSKGFTEPTTYGNSIACKIGHGYIVKFTCDDASDVYVRIYVIRSLTKDGKKIGAEIKYQYPFGS